jgi:hypothetical protein
MKTLIILLMLVTPASAMDFKGFTFGEEAPGTQRCTWELYEEDGYHSVCRFDDTVGGVHGSISIRTLLNSEPVHGYPNEPVYSAYVYFDYNNGYDKLVTALTSKYGPPSRTEKPFFGDKTGKAIWYFEKDLIALTMQETYMGLELRHSALDRVSEENKKKQLVDDL